MQSLHSRIRFAPAVFILVLLPVAIGISPVRAAGLGSCLWGGSNEETTYTLPYIPALGRMRDSTSTYAPSPNVNLNAPPGTALPVRSDVYGTIQIPQSSIQGQPDPGAVGTITQPATFEQNFTPGQPAGSQLLYVVPGGEPKADPLRPNSRVAVASNVVPAGTPGAVPVKVRDQTAYRAQSKTQWTFDRTTNTRLTRIDVVHPRTGRLMYSYYRQEEVRSLLPWFHPKETVDYVPVTVPIATPVHPATINRATYPKAVPPTYSNGMTGNATTIVN